MMKFKGLHPKDHACLMFCDDSPSELLPIRLRDIDFMLSDEFRDELRAVRRLMTTGIRTTPHDDHDWACQDCEREFAEPGECPDCHTTLIAS